MRTASADFAPGDHPPARPARLGPDFQLAGGTSGDPQRDHVESPARRGPARGPRTRRVRPQHAVRARGSQGGPAQRGQRLGEAGLGGAQSGGVLPVPDGETQVDDRPDRCRECERAERDQDPEDDDERAALPAAHGSVHGFLRAAAHSATGGAAPSGSGRAKRRTAVRTAAGGGLGPRSIPASSRKENRAESGQAAAMRGPPLIPRRNTPGATAYARRSFGFDAVGRTLPSPFQSAENSIVSAPSRVTP